MNCKQLACAGLLLLGTALGALGAYKAARAIQVQTGRQELHNYARRLLEASPRLLTESDHAVSAVLGAHLPLCSASELSFIRDYVYNAAHVKHIGRIENGLLHCTTGVGVLSPPEPMPAHAVISYEGYKVYRVGRIVISKTATDAVGLVVEHRGVSVVLNPSSYRGLDESPRLAAGFLIDPITSRTVEIFGHPVALSDTQIAAAQFVERDGVFLQPLCARKEMVCVVALESRADLLAAGRGFIGAFCICGMLLGNVGALIPILLCKRRGTLERQLRRAIRHDKLALVYQPIIDLDTGVVVGAEALLRWVNEDGKPVSPEVFVALAEKRGFVGELTQWVIRKVTAELGEALSAGLFTVTVNVSSLDLTNPMLFKTLEECLRSAQLPPAAIGLEVTERVAADHQRAVDAIALLKQAGHTVYVDDFGTGFSNLACLHRLAADVIKIDRIFTKMLGTSLAEYSIVPQILAMADQLNLRVVVEGIETCEQAEYFRARGIHVLAQGFLFSPGVPARQIKDIFLGRVMLPGHNFPGRLEPDDQGCLSTRSAA
jgi:sensor c-di-GMP phosphodiesterase-like protein